MNFYYDPIKGLQYEYLGEIIILDIDQIPENFNAAEFLKEWQIYRTWQINPFPEVGVVGQITKYVQI